MRKGQRVPYEIVETLLRARQQLLDVATRCADPMYEDELNRSGMASDCAYVAEHIDDLIERWRIPVARYGQFLKVRGMTR